MNKLVWSYGSVDKVGLWAIGRKERCNIPKTTNFEIKNIVSLEHNSYTQPRWICCIGPLLEIGIQKVYVPLGEKYMTYFKKKLPVFLKVDTSYKEGKISEVNITHDKVLLSLDDQSLISLENFYICVEESEDEY